MIKGILMLTLKRFVTIFTQILFIGITFNPSYSQEENPIKVGLSITANERLKNEITSYISRELRSLGDVSVSEISGDYFISIIAIELSKNEISFGYVISFTVTEPLDNNKIASLIKDENDKARVLMELKSHNYEFQLKKSITSLPKEELASECKSFIAQFDTTTLALNRSLKERQRQWDDLFKKINIKK